MNWYKILKLADQFTDFLSPEEATELKHMNDTIVLYQKAIEELQRRGQTTGFIGTEDQDIGNNEFMISKIQQKIEDFKKWVLKNRGKRQNHSVLNAAIDRYKLTEDPNVAGYIIPDGNMLDFSGGSVGGGYRNIDHKTVADLLGKPGLKMTEGMYAFMRLTGAVRIMYFFPTYMFINFKGPVTQPQISRIISIGRDIETIKIEGPSSDAYKELNQKHGRKISPHKIRQAIDELV